jgi:hypothetical protein
MNFLRVCPRCVINLRHLISVESTPDLHILEVDKRGSGWISFGQGNTYVALSTFEVKKKDDPAAFERVSKWLATIE